MPRFIGLNAWNWGAKTGKLFALYSSMFSFADDFLGFFWAGACFILCTWTYFRLPEAKGRTYGELDVLFEHKVSARKFHKTRVDQFAGEHTDIVQETSDSDVEKTLHEHKA